MNDHRADLAGQIAALDDAAAIAALHLVLERQGQPVDPIDLRDNQNRLEQALNQPGIRQLAPPDPAATPATLARTALHHLAAQDQASASLIQHAITRTALPAERLEPCHPRRRRPRPVRVPHRPHPPPRPRTRLDLQTAYQTPQRQHHRTATRPTPRRLHQALRRVPAGNTISTRLFSWQRIRADTWLRSSTCASCCPGRCEIWTTPLLRVRCRMSGMSRWVGGPACPGSLTRPAPGGHRRKRPRHGPRRHRRPGITASVPPRSSAGPPRSSD